MIHAIYCSYVVDKDTNTGQEETKKQTNKQTTKQTVTDCRIVSKHYCSFIYLLIY